VKPRAIDSEPDRDRETGAADASPTVSIRNISRPSSKCSKLNWDLSSFGAPSARFGFASRAQTWICSATANTDADKLRSQISFLSLTPRADLEALATWAREHGMNAEVGNYSDHFTSTRRRRSSISSSRP
jgi:hypothetical protein